MSEKKLFIGNIPPSLSAADFLLLAAELAPESPAELIRDKRNGHSKGFGFITVTDDRVEATLEKLRTCEVGGRILRAEVAKVVEEKSTETATSESGSGELEKEGSSEDEPLTPTSSSNSPELPEAA